MKKYRVAVPIHGFETYLVEATDEAEAIDQVESALLGEKTTAKVLSTENKDTYGSADEWDVELTN